MFKKLLMAAIIFFVAITAKAGDQRITSKIQKVIVFLNGAQVTRTATVNVNSGTSTLIFQNISPSIDVQSIQVHANGEFTILSVKHEIDFLNEQIKQKKLEDLKAQQKTIKDKIDFQNNLYAIYQEEQNMLVKNQAIGGQNTGVDILKLKQALDFQTERLTMLKKKQQDISEQVLVLTNELQKYNKQIGNMSNGSTSSTSNILVTVSAKAPLQTGFTLSYVVNNASWYPTYDIRAKNINSPISISYKASVSQQSGEDWKNIKLTLSTGNPSVSGSKPELQPYYLYYGRSYNLPYGGLISDKEKIKSQREETDSSPPPSPPIDAKQPAKPSIPLAVNQVENQTNIEFNIDNPYSVPNDGKQYTVEINQFSLDAIYQYAVAPKLSTDVFLTAKLTDWNKYNFLSGEANLFFEGTFIGKSLINANVTTDTLNLSLGADKNIVVTRTSIENLTSRQSLGSNKKETRDWQIEIKNRKNQAVNLLVEDQVPVSQNSSIEVEPQELSGGKLDKITGKVTWSMPLKVGDDKKLELKYQVKYPKNQYVIVE